MLSNRRMRTRTYGGVGGVKSKGFPLSRLNRKNALFARCDEGAEAWACLASLIETCKLNGADPEPYLTGVLEKLVNGWPAARIDELLPWAQGFASPTSTAETQIAA